MAKSRVIGLPDGTIIPILYEDRAVLAVDKPVGWMLAPDSWDQTGRNLHLALLSGIQGGDFWARSRNLKFLRFVHRLDADTSGVLLFVKNPGAARAYSRLFETRRVEKIYLAVVHGVPIRREWTCRLKLGPDSNRVGRVRVDSRRGKEAETQFRVLQAGRDIALVEARPLTGRTHQIRVHLAESGHPVLNDALYARLSGEAGRRTADAKPATRNSMRPALALRAVLLAFPDPFQKRTIRIEAPREEFCKRFGI